MAVPPDGLTLGERRPDVLRRARPARQDVRVVIEREHEELVVGVQELEEEPFDGRSRVDHALAEHAVAHVEQDAEADRHALVRELGDRLRLAVLEHLEGLARKADREAALRVEDRRRDGDDVDARPEHTVARA